MARYGSMGRITAIGADQVLPGAPTIGTPTQKGSTWMVPVTLPLKDPADPKYPHLLVVAVVDIVGGFNPLDGITDMAVALGLPGVQQVQVVVSEAQAGTSIDVADLPVVDFAGDQEIFAALSDQ